MGLKREECHSFVHELLIRLRTCILILYLVEVWRFFGHNRVRYAATSFLIRIDTTFFVLPCAFLFGSKCVLFLLTPDREDH